MILVPILLLGAVGAGLVMSGIVKTPWTSKKKVSAKIADTKKITLPKQAEAARVVAKKPVPRPTMDPALGTAKIAKVWNEVPSDKLIAMWSQWKDPELAVVLAKMDSDKVSEILGKLDPIRASALSRAMQKQASIIAPESTKS